MGDESGWKRDRRMVVVESKEKIEGRRSRTARRGVSSLWLATSKGLIEDEG